MSILQVSTTAQLYAAASAARAGDEIRLAAGTYSGVTLSGLNFAGTVTITSADATNPAIFTDLQVRQSNNLTISNVELTAPSTSSIIPFMIANSSNVVLDHVEVSGPKLATGADEFGLWIRESSSVVVKNSEFHDLGDGIYSLNSSGVSIYSNTFHDIRSDGVQASGTSNLTVSSNLFTNFYPEASDHPDAVQIFTSGTTASAENITISGNLIARGDGGAIQGVFMNNELALAYKNVNITDNLLIGTMYNGIAIDTVASGSITNNTVVGLSDMTSWIRAASSPAVVYTNNQASSYYGFSGGIPSSNSVAAPLTDGGEALLAAWLSTHAMPGYSDPADAQLLSSIGLLDGSALSQPVVSQPVVSEPAVSQPVVSQPVVSQPVVSEPAVSQPAPPPTTLVQTIKGGESPDTLHSVAASTSILYGFGGNDFLLGNGTASEMHGGKGDDSYQVYGPGDKVVELAGEGSDTVYAAVNYTLGANVEHLVLQGSAQNGTGNELANNITGNDLSNILYGLDGNDWIQGLAGNDVIYGGKGDDILKGDSGDDVLNGDAGNDTISGGAGNDILNGGDGNDTLDGGTGNDKMNGGSGKDIFLFRNEVAVSHDKDEIFGFEKGKDIINLTMIDANSKTVVDDAFKFIGNSAFHSVAGELQAKNYGDGVMVSGDVNGDGVADFQIYVHNVTALAANNFYL